LHNTGSNEDEQRTINNLKVIIACNKAECFVRYSCSSQCNLHISLTLTFIHPAKEPPPDSAAGKEQHIPAYCVCGDFSGRKKDCHYANESMHA
jgi:hypothetical protein